jgi:2-phospho-L-lactate transferase/gluconeogenesis factor (CofD/UPF0052 family)
VKICCFSGGRGAQTIVLELSKVRNIDLSLIVNGFDDGKSTGEIRRLVPNFLGPSDFRKVMSALATPATKSQVALSTLMEFRVDIQVFDVNKSILDQLKASKKINELYELLDRSIRKKIEYSLDSLMEFFQTNELVIPRLLQDMSIGNLIFAGIYISKGMSFENMLSEISEMLELGCSIHSASDSGGNYTLVGILENGDFLLNESSIVESRHSSSIIEIGFVKTNFVEELNKNILGLKSTKERIEELKRFAIIPEINTSAYKAILDSEVIIYPPGTQYSSLYPSYEICSEAVKYSKAKKRVLFCNLDYDNDIINLNWQEIVDRFLKYHNDEANKYSLTDLFIDKNTEITGDRLLIYKNIKVHYVSLRSLRNNLKHSGIIVRDCISNLYYQKNENPTVKVLTAIPDALNNYNKLHEDLSEIADVKSNLIIINETHVIGDNASLHETYNKIIIEKTSQWLNKPETDYLLIHGFDGLYDSLDVLSLISALKNNHSAVAVGNRFTSKKSLQKARSAAYGNSILNGALSTIGGWLIKLVFEIRFKSVIEDPLSGMILLSRSEIERINLRGTEFYSIPILIAEIIKRGGDITSQSINYWPLRGFRSQGKLKLGLKTLYHLLFKGL